MKRIRKYSLQIAAAAIVAVVLTLAAPRAVHAVTAALVNVTNTAASPAIGQSVSQLASQNVFLRAGLGGISPGIFATLAQEFASGTTSSSGFVVPPGQSLVVTSIDVETSGGGTYYVFIYNGVSTSLRTSLAVTPAGTTEFQYPSGIVFPAGESVLVANGGSSPGTVIVLDMHGYLTSN